MQNGSNRFIKAPRVREKLSISRASLYDRLNPKSPYFDPTFPKQIRLSSSPRGSVAWLEAEIEEWMAGRLSQR